MDAGSKTVPVQITEDEAAVYDRQIRLWGIEAQQRMRNASILVINLKGVATEAIKNIVLAGIGKLVIVDPETVAEEDLGACFFLRGEDVGRKRVEAAKGRVESLNPLVAVETISDGSVLEGPALDALIQTVDLVCMTDSSRAELSRVNEACRRLKKPFYSGGSYGLLGYIFCDLQHHEFISPDRTGTKDVPRSVKASLDYPSLQNALQHKWSTMTKRQTKEVNPAVVFTVLAIWEFEARNNRLPSEGKDADALEQLANEFISAAGVDKKVLTHIPRDLVEYLSTTAAHEFSPICAVVGGMLGQDILKSLAAREAPIANFFAFDGHTGTGTVTRMNMP
ncbi:hypothetical protein HDZ31DRAFT_37145 [Schizophyllum fasciatum]